MVYLNNSEISDLAKKVIQKYKEYIGVEWELFKVEPNVEKSPVCGRYFDIRVFRVNGENSPFLPGP